MTFAQKNIIIYESNSKDSNDFLIKISKDTPLDQQTSFNSKINVFNLAETTNMKIDNNGFRFSVFGPIFNSPYKFNIEFNAPFNYNIKNAEFRAKSIFDNGLISKFEGRLISAANQWVKFVLNLVKKVENKFKQLKLK